MQQYDHDKLVPAYGFGAVVKGRTSHSFALTLRDDETSVNGVNGLLGAYE